MKTDGKCATDSKQSRSAVTWPQVSLRLTSGNEWTFDTQERKSEREREKSKGPETPVSNKESAKSVISRTQLAFECGAGLSPLCGLSRANASSRASSPPHPGRRSGSFSCRRVQTAIAVS